jgi:hypothetical protein
MAKKGYKELNLRQKCELIHFLESHSERRTAEEFGVSKTTVNNIKKRKSEYLDRLQTESEEMSRKKRATEFDDINSLTLKWFTKMRGLNLRLSGPMLQEVALKFARELNQLDFKASSGWLESFKMRNNISSKVLIGDSNEVDPEVVSRFQAKFSDFVGDFEPKNIFNADECGLFYKAMPDHSLVIKGDSCKAGKRSKERLTVLLCASITGEKLQPFVIGKSTNPRCFKNMAPHQLPVTWRSHRKAWMNTELFIEWLKLVNTFMRKQKRHILLIVDNCPSHCPVEKLSNLTVKCLPPNTTSILQPLDQGVIKTFKAFYRKLLLKEVVRRCEGSFKDSASKEASKINVLDAILWISDAWNSVKEGTIQKCFRKAGFVLDGGNDDENQEQNPGAEVTVLIPEVENINEFIDCDRDTVTTETGDSEDVFGSILNEFKKGKDESESSEDEGGPYRNEEEKPLSHKEVYDMLEKIASCYATTSCPELLMPIYQARKIVADEICRNKNLKQSRIDVFFTKNLICCLFTLSFVFSEFLFRICSIVLYFFVFHIIFPIIRLFAYFFLRDFIHELLQPSFCVR